MIRLLSELLKKHTKLVKIVKISEIFNRLVFPLNFNRFCHPMTIVVVVKLFIYFFYVNSFLYSFFTIIIIQCKVLFLSHFTFFGFFLSCK